MSGIGGDVREQRENVESEKKVGLFEAKVIAINPSIEQYKTILGIELKEDSKSVEYLGESRDGNVSLRVDFWLKEVKDGGQFRVSYFLEDKVRENKDGTKKQYINSIGLCTWASDEDNIPEWFKNMGGVKRDFREAYVGEEEFYGMLRVWLGGIDFSKENAILSVEWKKLMRANVKELTNEIDGTFSRNIMAMATVSTKEKDGDYKQYQNVFNKAIASPYMMKFFRNKDYDDSRVTREIALKKPKDLTNYERFYLSIAGDYGCKDYYLFKDLQNYNPDANILSSDKAISDDASDY